MGRVGNDVQQEMPPLTPHSSLPAAWMKEKAAPGDVRYCGEFSPHSCFEQVRGA